MATPSAALPGDRLGQGVPKSKRKLQKHLRNAGLAYISRTGKLIPAKQVAAELCQCPQKCDSKVPTDVRERLFAHFYGLGEADLQNDFLRQNMDLRARLFVPDTSSLGGISSNRPPRRITCKYLVPLLPKLDETIEVCQKAFVSAFVITTKRVRLQREKLISSLGLNSYSSQNRSCHSIDHMIKFTTPAINEKYKNNTYVNMQDQLVPLNLMKYLKSDLTLSVSSTPAIKNFDSMGATQHNSMGTMNEPRVAELPPFAFQQTSIPSSSCTIVNSVRDKRGNISVRNLVDNPLLPLGLLVPDGLTIAPVTATADHDRDIAIVNNFFSNQLWKPEYIGTYS